MKKPTPSPCDNCPPYKKVPCDANQTFCLKWAKWIMSKDSEERYKQMKLR